MFRYALANGKLSLEQSLVGVVAQASHLTSGAHVHAEHRVGLLQAVE